MLILSILAFFVVIFLLASITVTVAWMAFLKTTAEESEATLCAISKTSVDESLRRCLPLATA